MSNARIIFLEGLPTISGGQRVLIDLAPALVRYFDVAAVLPGEGPLAEALRACGVRVIFAPMASYTLVGKDWRDLMSFVTETPRLAWTLRGLVRQHRAQIVYANSSRTFIWGTLGAWLAGRPVIWHAHNILGDLKTQALVRMFARTKTVRQILCTSEEAAAQFPQQRDKIVVAPPGVDLEQFAPLSSARAATRAELGIAADTPVVGIVGDLIPLKGQDVFIRAATRVAQSAPEAVFLIVGDERPTDESRRFKSTLQSAISSLQSGPRSPTSNLQPLTSNVRPPTSDLRLPASDLRHLTSNIRMLGFRPDIAAILNALDVLVVASTTETGPLVLMQALACGVPVISTPVGRAAQLLGDGACGDLVPIGDDVALAEKLSNLLARPAMRAAMSQAARRRAVERLDQTSYRACVVNVISAEVGRLL